MVNAISVMEMQVCKLQVALRKLQAHYPTNFSGRQGTKNIPAGTRSPGAFQSLLLSDTILEQFVRETNLYGKNNPSTYSLNNNNAVTLGEMKKLIAVILFMGWVQLPSREMFWEQGSVGSSFVKSCFSRRRVYTSSTNLHWRMLKKSPISLLFSQRF